MKELVFETDIAIVGGGAAGSAAAIASARNGADVVLIERNSFLGGMATAGLIPTFCPVNEGMLTYVGKELFETAVESLTFLPDSEQDWPPIEAERLKVILEDMTDKSGVRILYNTVLSSLKVENGKITQIELDNSAGKIILKARVFIDCSGNADLARMSGAKTVSSESLQPSTLCFYLGGIDAEQFKKEECLHPSNPNSPVYEIVRDSDFPDIDSPHFCIAFIYKNIAGINAGYINDVNIDEPFKMSERIMKGRRIASQYEKALKKYVKAFKDCFLITTAPSLGIRESYRVKGAYTLTGRDYINRAKFNDAIAKNDYYLDVHSDKLSELYMTKEDSGKIFNNYEKGEYYEVPYRCLLSTRTNLLSAGRIISTDSLIQGSARTIPFCFATGQAAGTAAALAIKHDTELSKIDIKELKNIIGLT